MTQKLSPEEIEQLRDGIQPIMPKREISSSDQEGQPFLTVETKRSGGVRVCTKCLVRKPDRTHHCRSCERYTILYG